MKFVEKKFNNESMSKDFDDPKMMQLLEKMENSIIEAGKKLKNSKKIVKVRIII